MNLNPGSGKTESLVTHIAYRTLGAHKGARRLWLEGQRLQTIGFDQGVRYQVAADGGVLTLRLSPAGDHQVSHKQGRPVVDVLTRALGDVERAEVVFTPGAIFVSLHPVDRAAAARLERLNARLASGQDLRLGSLSHGGGVASDALLRGLQGAGLQASLEFGLDISADYLEQSLTHGPLAAGGTSIEADLGDLDPTALGEVEVLEAGLPCVAASRAGRSKKHLRRPESDLQVADLAAAFCEVIRATQPAVVVLENVPEYADSASADLIRRRLARWGYTLHERVLEGTEHALENRRRWVLVAATRGLSLDPDAILGAPRPATLGEVLDDVSDDDPAWRSFEHLDTHQARHQAAGNGFRQQLLTPSSTRVPTLRRGYQKGGTTDPRLLHPTRPGLSRLLSPAEHARIKGIPPALVEGLSAKKAHEVLGQSVISPAFVGLGHMLGTALA